MFRFRKSRKSTVWARSPKCPRPPQFIEGITNLRGEVIPVLDTRRRFELEAKTSDDDRTRIIIVDIGGVKTGLVVDSVREVLNLARKDIAPPPEAIGSGIDQHFISGHRQGGCGQAHDRAAGCGEDSLPAGAGASGGNCFVNRKPNAGPLHWAPATCKAMKRIRVLVADDSALMRQTLKRIIGASAELDLVGLARDGEDAVTKAQELRPDVIAMDINMPKLDGVTALQMILHEKICPVVMVSSLTQQGAMTTFECLELGAFDFVAKPDGTVSSHMGGVADELISKLKAAARRGIVDRLRGNRNRRQSYGPPVRGV